MDDAQARCRAWLLEAVSRYGRGVLDDARRCRALLMDFCGDCRGEIHLLVSALQERVVEALASPTPGVPAALRFGRLIRRLQDHYYVPESAARWAVESCALALAVEPPKTDVRVLVSDLPAAVLGRRWSDVAGAWQTLGATPGRVVVPEDLAARLNLYADDATMDVLVRDLAGFGPLEYLDVGLSPLTDHGLATLRAVRGLLYLDLSRTRIGDGGLAALAAHSHLIALYLRGCDRITSRGLTYLSAFKGLESLDLGRCPGVVDDALVLLQNLVYLTRLNLSDTRITDAGLVQLENLTHLRRLDLSETAIVGETLEALSGLPVLDTLSLFRCVHLNPRWLSSLQHFPHLTHVDVGGCGQINDRNLAPVRALHGLVDLGLAGLAITDAGLLHLTSLVALMRLDVSWTQMSDLGIERLSSLAMLRSLALAGTRITDRALAILARNLPDLVSLDLSNTAVTEAGMASLTLLGRLAELNLEGTALDDAGLAHIAEIPALARLYIGDTDVTDAGLMLLSRMPKLSFVDVTLCRHVTLAGLDVLASSGVVVEG